MYRIGNSSSVFSSSSSSSLRKADEDEDEETDEESRPLAVAESHRVAGARNPTLIAAPPALPPCQRPNLL
jgi:hypothetical protein